MPLDITNVVAADRRRTDGPNLLPRWTILLPLNRVSRLNAVNITASVETILSLVRALRRRSKVGANLFIALKCDVARRS